MALNTLNKPNLENAVEKPQPQEKPASEKLTPQQHLLKLFEHHQLTPQQSKEVYNHAVKFVNPDTPEEVLLATHGTSLDRAVLDTLLDLRHDRVPQTSEVTEVVETSEAVEELEDPAETGEGMDSQLEVRADVEAIIGEFMTKDSGTIPQIQEAFAKVRRYSEATEYSVDNFIESLQMLSRYDPEGVQGQFAKVLSNNLENNRAALQRMSADDAKSFLNSFGL